MSHDADDDRTVEFYFPSYMVHWHPTCPHGLQEDEQLVFTINKHKVSAVIKREFDNLSPVEIKTYHDEV
eukprot:4757001-Prorocentrum_lima.AAC.1